MPKTTTMKPMAEWLQIESTAADWNAVGKDELMRMHFHLHLIRAFEEAVLQVNNDGLVHGPAHSSIGQEGGAVGSIAPLRTADQVSGAHRGHHQFLAKALNYVDAPAHNPLQGEIPEAIR